MLERHLPERDDLIMFCYNTKGEGQDALLMAVDLVAGQCGNFFFIPPSSFRASDHGFLGFSLIGNTNALAGLCFPFMRKRLFQDLGIDENGLKCLLATNLRKHGWYIKLAD